MELVEVMSQKANSERVGYATGKKMKESIVAAAKQQLASHAFGVLSLPSDNMNAIMHNDFNKQFLKHKTTHDDMIAQA